MENKQCVGILAEGFLLQLSCCEWGDSDCVLNLCKMRESLWMSDVSQTQSKSRCAPKVWYTGAWSPF